MPLPYDYREMLKLYETDLEVLGPGGGYYDEETGKWQRNEDPPTEMIRAAVVPLTGKDLSMDETGKRTGDDLKAYTHFPLQVGQRVRVFNRRFLVEDEKDFARFAKGLRIYTLVREGAAHD